MKLNYVSIILILFLFGVIGFTGCDKKAETSQDDNSDSKLSEEQELSDTKIKYDNESDISGLKEQELSDLVKNLSLPYCERKTLSAVYTMDTLKSEGIGEIVRCNQGKYYSVTRIEGGRYLFLLYYGADAENHFLIDGFLVSGFADKSFFEDISKGMKQKEILGHDPCACLVLDGERSYHRFSDKSILEITYTKKKKHYVVSGFEFLEDQVSVLNYLLPQDLEKILPEGDNEKIEQQETVSDPESFFVIEYDNESDIEKLEEQELSDQIKRLNLPYCIRVQGGDLYDIEILKSKGIAQIIRYHQDRYYSVTHIEGGRYLFLLYDGTEVGSDQFIDGFLFFGFADKSFFENISKGMKQQEILGHDPSACLIWDGERSYHRFSDKSILEITYTQEKGQYVVSGFEFLEDQISVLDYLLPKDLEKIQKKKEATAHKGS